MPSASGGEKPRGSDKRGPGCHRPQPISSSKAFCFFFFSRGHVWSTPSVFLRAWERGGGERGTMLLVEPVASLSQCRQDGDSAIAGVRVACCSPPPHHARSHLSPPRRPRGAPKGCSPSVETFFCPLFGSVFSLLSEGKGGSGRRRRRERRWCQACVSSGRRSRGKPSGIPARRTPLLRLMSPLTLSRAVGGAGEKGPVLRGGERGEGKGARGEGGSWAAGGRAGDPGALEHPRVLLLNDLRELFSF